MVGNLPVFVAFFSLWLCFWPGSYDEHCATPVSCCRLLAKADSESESETRAEAESDFDSMDMWTE